MTLLRDVLRWLFRRALGIYFREVAVRGPAPARDTGGRLIAANHFNGMVDPLLVLTATRCAVAPVAKSTLFRVPVLRALLRVVDAVPVLRRRDAPEKSGGANEEAFARVAAHLGARRNVLIFPEGTSHGGARVLPLRSGAARMLARATRDGTRGLTYQAVGLEFDARDTFRSRALVSFGPVREVDALVAQGLEGEALVAAITAQLAADLEALVVAGASPEEQDVVARIAGLSDGTRRGNGLAARSDALRVIAALRARAHAGDAALLERLDAEVSSYYAALERARTTDREVVGSATPTAAWTRLAARSGLALAAIGAAIHYVPYRVTGPLATRLAGEHGDLRSTYKLAASLLIFPLWTAAVCGFALATLPARLGPVALVLVACSPLAAIRFADAMDVRAGRWWPTPDFAALRARRRALIESLAPVLPTLARDAT